jgi:uncharacterized protein (DUF736 family)
MATAIGTFTNRDGKITGKIQTLTLNAALTFLPNENQTNPDAPAYRIFAANKAEVGGAWEKIAEASGKKYLSVRLDDPTFTGPVYASLLEQEDGTHTLIWSRRS